MKTFKSQLEDKWWIISSESIRSLKVGWHTTIGIPFAFKLSQGNFYIWDKTKGKTLKSTYRWITTDSIQFENRAVKKFRLEEDQILHTKRSLEDGGEGNHYTYLHVEKLALQKDLSEKLFLTKLIDHTWKTDLKQNESRYIFLDYKKYSNPPSPNNSRLCLNFYIEHHTKLSVRQIQAFERTWSFHIIENIIYIELDAKLFAMQQPYQLNKIVRRNDFDEIMKESYDGFKILAVNSITDQQLILTELNAQNHHREYRFQRLPSTK